MTATEKTPDQPYVRQRLNVIDVAIAFDAATLMEIPDPSADPDRPTQVDPNRIHMMTAGKEIAGNPGWELRLDARVGDVVRWHERTLSSNFDYAVLLYRYSAGNVISNPVLLLDETAVAYPANSVSEAPDPRPRTAKNYSWAAFVTGTGGDFYQFCFQIIDRGRPKGYFSWDLYITTDR